MRTFSRIEAAAILLTTSVVCGFAVPSFFPESTVRNWPAWAQHRITLGPDVQGGSSFLLQVDRSDVRAQLLKSVRLDVHSELRDAGVKWASAPRVRGDSVEVRLLDSTLQAGLATLRELSTAPIGPRLFDVVDVGAGLVRVTPTDAAVDERVHLTANQSVPIMERRFNELGLAKINVERQGPDRILVQMPALFNPRLLE
jgi:preprotein translocase subunit SecD